jgi:hypothetical protein
LTSGLAGGEYTIRVTAVDELGQTSTQELILNIGGASILLDPSMVTFSNSHPANGDKVTVFLTLANMGESNAEDLTVTLFDGDEVLESFSGISIPAKGSSFVSTELKASGTHEITAKISSSTTGDLEMEEAAILETTEDEMIMEDMGGIIGLIALILAMIAIVIAVFLGMRKGGEEERTEAREAQIREKQEQSRDRAPSLGGSTGGRPELPGGPPPSQQKKQEALPGPTVAPVSMPKPESRPEPKPAPMQTPPRSDSIQYMAPNKK